MIRGRGLFRERWYSICSIHQEHDPTCDLCVCGMWHNVWAQRIDSLICRFAYPLWYWLHNRNWLQNRGLRKP